MRWILLWSVILIPSREHIWIFFFLPTSVIITAAVTFFSLHICCQLVLLSSKAHPEWHPCIFKVDLWRFLPTGAAHLSSFFPFFSLIGSVWSFNYVWKLSKSKKMLPLVWERDTLWHHRVEERKTQEIIKPNHHLMGCCNVRCWSTLTISSQDLFI